MNFWDHNFSGAGYKYGTAPNAFIAAEAQRLAPQSRVLVPGDGEGRNGVWLAQQGHEVTAVDCSSVGLDKARSLAAQRGVQLHTELADLTEWQVPVQPFDALCWCSCTCQQPSALKCINGCSKHSSPAPWC